MQSFVSRFRRLEAPGAARLLPTLIVVAVYLAGAIGANAGPAVAPAGPCATSREAISGSSQSSGPSSPLSIVGPLGAFFNPADVAAAPVIASRPAPSAAAMLRPGACDNPGAACGLTPVLTRGFGVPLIVGGTRP